MRTLVILVAFIGSASPTLAQTSKVYTNADLTSKPVSTWTRTVTPAEWSGIVSRQFIAPPETPGASASVLPWSGDRPGFLPDNNRIVMAGSGSYADDLWRDPVTAYAVQHPIEAAYGFGLSRGAHIMRSERQSSDAGAGRTPTATPPAPPIVTTGASAGRRVR